MVAMVMVMVALLVIAVTMMMMAIAVAVPLGAVAMTTIAVTAAGNDETLQAGYLFYDNSSMHHHTNVSLYQYR